MDRPRRRLRMGALAAAGAIALLAGCGDSEPTAAEFSSEVNAACRQALDAAAQDGGAAQGQAPSARVAPLNRLVARLDEIDPPADLAAQYDRYKDAMKGFALYARLNAAGDAGDALAGAQEQIARAQQTLLSTTRALRLADCI